MKKAENGSFGKQSLPNHCKYTIFMHIKKKKEIRGDPHSQEGIKTELKLLRYLNAQTTLLGGRKLPTAENTRKRSSFEKKN